MTKRENRRFQRTRANWIRLTLSRGGWFESSLSVDPVDFSRQGVGFTVNEELFIVGDALLVTIQ